jgi:putative transposase
MQTAGLVYVGASLWIVLKEAEAGADVLDLCRKHGISDATFYKWKAKYGGMTVADLRRLKELEAGNPKLKRIVADQALDNAALKDLSCLVKKCWRHTSRAPDQFLSPIREGISPSKTAEYLVLPKVNGSPR